MKYLCLVYGEEKSIQTMDDYECLTFDQGLRDSGHKVTMVYGLIAELRKRIQDGETADVMILSRAALDDLQSQGKVASGSIVNLASSYVAIAVRAGAAKPDIGSVDALKRTLLAARSIVYADPAKGGASGVHFAKVLDRLGMTDQMKPKTILVPGAQAAEVVARGEAEMGVAQASEIVPIAGAQLVGPLPGDLNNVTADATTIKPGTNTSFGALKQIDAGVLNVGYAHCRHIQPHGRQSS